MSRTNDGIYLRMRAKLKAIPGLVCVVCGQGIDVSLPSSDPMSFTADHVDPVALGGSNRGELAPAHKVCNQKRGVKPLDAVRVDQHSRTW